MQYTMSSKSSILLSFLILVTTITPLLSLIPPKVHQEANGLGKRKGFTAKFIHRDSPQSPLFKHNLTRSDRIIASLQRSRSRSLYLSNRRRNHIDALQAQLVPDHGEYVMSFSIGSPAVETFALADTGGDMFWLQCLPCEECYAQEASIFDPSQSQSYKKISCTDQWCNLLDGKCDTVTDTCLYEVSYGDESYSHGNLASETLTFNGILVPNVIFGCGHKNRDTYAQDLKPPGNIGLNMGPFSFISQQKITKFSYCLVENKKDVSSYIHFQPDVIEFQGPSTPILDIFEEDTDFYLGLEGISVGQNRLPLPEGFFDVTSTGEGGLIIDSGATYTELKPEAYDKLTEEMKRHFTFLRQVIRTEDDPQVVHFDVCYVSTMEEIISVAPDVTFHFGGGLDLVLNKEGTWVDMGQGQICLAMAKAFDDTSIFGNHQQINMNIIYDLGNKQISFMKMASCNGRRLRKR